MKNNNMFGNIYRIIILLLFAASLNSCDRGRNVTGWDYFPDMFYSTAYESYTRNPNFKDGMTMRTPVPGTVPRGFTPFNYTIDAESRKLAGIELVNPVASSTESVKRGEKVYSIFCINCHGATGDGNGHLYKSGLYPIKPKPLIGGAADLLKDGEIYHTITLGFGSMGAHGSQIRPEERWMVINYIRKLQELAKETTDSDKDSTTN